MPNTAASDDWGQPQGLAPRTSGPHAALSLTDIPVTPAFIHHLPVQQQPLHFSPCQPYTNTLFLPSETYIEDRGQCSSCPNSVPVCGLSSNSTYIHSETSKTTEACSNADTLPLFDASASTALPSSMMQQCHFPTASLRRSFPSQVREVSGIFSYQAEKALEGDRENVQRLFLPCTSHQTFGSATISSAENSYNPFTSSGSYLPTDHWMSLPPYTAPAPIIYPATSSFHDISLEPPTLSSSATSSADLSRSEYSRQIRPGSANPGDLTNYGFANDDGSWRCAYPGCSSQAAFRRGCDLRKHFNRHRKYLFCRHEGCPQATEGGFSSKKDRARHEAKHNPGIPCEWKDCGRMFSRVDNMKDHVRRIHKKRASR